MGLSKREIREMAMLQASAPDYWDDTKLSNRYCCTLYSLRKYKQSDTWQEIYDFVPSLLPYVNQKQDIEFQKNFMESLATWTERRKKQASIQLDLGIMIGTATIKAMKDFDNTLEAIKTYGPSIKSMVSAWRELSQEASEVEQTCFALEEILEKIDQNIQEQLKLV